MVGPAELGVEELEESAMADEVVAEASDGEADHGRPLIGFPKTVGDLESDSSVPTTDRRGPTDKLDLPLRRAGQVHPDQGGHALVEKRRVGAGVQETIA